ncbi:MAG: hypothetical protein NTW87_09195, partial [Planctomycetota bacterium]|nr:hypothetical protein [Planctomycetota bacterium]
MANPNSLPINGTEADFFRRLAEMTIAHESQPFFVPYDGKIVARVCGERFKLCPRPEWSWDNPGAFMPVLVGEVASGEVRWYFRRMLFVYLFLAAWFLVPVSLVVGSGPRGDAAMAGCGFFFALMGYGLFWVGCRLGKRHEQTMEGIVRCAAGGTD